MSVSIISEIKVRTQETQFEVKDILVLLAQLVIVTSLDTAFSFHL